MTIDDLKEEFRKTRAPEMRAAAPGEAADGGGEFIRRLRQQDREDERYIIRNRIIPIGAGIVLFAVLMTINPIHNAVMLGGCLLLFFSLLSTLVLYLIDYMNISRESFDSSVYEFLLQKERRLRYWRATAHKYNVIFGLYLIGLLMMTLGNTSILRDFTWGQVTVYLVIIVNLLIVFWVIGELKFRKRHVEHHKPLLDMIAEIKGETD